MPWATCSYPVPILKVQNYTIEEIFEKNLLFLIPFHIFTYEKEFQEYETDENRLSELTRVYEGIMERLDTYAMEQRINEYTKRTIIDMSKKVLEHLAKKYSNVKEGVGAIMGGKILDHEAKDILNMGIAKGREEGREEGREQGVRLAKKVYQLNAQGKCNEDIAIECDISVEKVGEILE